MFSSISTISRFLAAGVVLSVLSIGFFSSDNQRPTADITLDSTTTNTTINNTFVVDVRLRATEPVNVFKGIVTFDPNAVTISSIDYNTSIADLWAEEPWYSNGDGTLTFIGGTTKPGGFTGDESILRITFSGTKVGQTSIGMRDIEILRHDGFGSNAPTPDPIDRIFTIAPAERNGETIARKEQSKSTDVTVLGEGVSTDLNGDGKHNLIDSSIFMTDLATQNLRSDFNQDGAVNLTDLSILNQQ